MRLVLDASVAIEIYVKESDSASALAWVGRATQLDAPDIVTVEVAQALLSHHREHKLSWAELSEAIGELGRNTRMVPSGELVGRGLDLAQALRHRLHDCMYLALAERLGCPLLTADERLTRKLEGARLPIAAILHHERAS